MSFPLLPNKIMWGQVLAGIQAFYGASGFEFQLGDAPKDSINSLYLQLRDQGGMPLSENVYINTYNSCDKNMVFITFRENK